MLPPYIIEQIRRREEELQRRQYEQPQIEMPMPSNMPRPSAPEQQEDEERVVIIDL